MMTQLDKTTAETRTADLVMALYVPLPSMHSPMALCDPLPFIHLPMALCVPLLPMHWPMMAMCV